MFRSWMQWHRMLKPNLFGHAQGFLSIRLYTCVRQYLPFLLRSEFSPTTILKHMEISFPLKLQSHHKPSVLRSQAFPIFSIRIQMNRENSNIDDTIKKVNQKDRMNVQHAIPRIGMKIEKWT